MQFLFVSVSRFAAIGKVERVLDNYGSRRAHNVWFARLQKEGVDVVHTALRRLADRHMAVTCYRIKGFQEAALEEVWHVGTRTAFLLSTGQYVLARSRQENVIPQIWTPEMQATVRLAGQGGAGHDVGGKPTRGFDHKLTGGQRKADPVRHELISVYVRRALLAGKQLTKKQFKQLVEDLLAQPEMPQLPIRAAEPEHFVDWQIVAHHRIPAGGMLETNHRQPLDKVKPAEAKRFTQLIDADFFQAPYFPALDRALQSVDYSCLAPCHRASMLYARAGIQISDHYVSGEPEQGDAHSFSFVRKGLQQPSRFKARANQWQALEPHSMMVSRVTERTTALLLDARFSEFLPGIPTEQITRLKKNAVGRFAWQRYAYEAVLELKASSEYGGGFIAFVAAPTGAGKTLGCALIAAGLCGEYTRITVVNGQRNLTLQTGDEYGNKAGLTRDQVAVLIGSQTVAMLHRLRQVDASDEDSPELMDERYIMQDSGQVHRLPRFLEREFDEQERSYLCSPVSIMTFDNLIKAADWRRSNWLRPFLRLLSAPLVIDEIDQYELQDLVVIGRLLFFAGLVGQRVIISTATLYPALAHQLYEAYAAGYAEHAHLMGKPKEPALLLVPDAGKPQRGFWSAEPAHQEISKFLRHLASNAAKVPQRRRGKILDIVSAEDAFRQVAQQIPVQFDKWQSPLDGYPLSLGVVRFAAVHNVVACLDYLARQDFGDLEVAFVPYHSRLTTAWRSLLEQKLDILLSERSDQDPVTSAMKALLEARVAKAKANGKRGLCVVVLSSPLEETGRNHDFDWGIAEPTAWRNLAQLVGRLLRFRLGLQWLPEEGDSNFLMFSHPLSHFDHPGKPAYARPGLEHAGKLLPSHDLKVIAPEANGPIHAGPCLDPQSYGLLAQYENERIESFLKRHLLDKFVADPAAMYTDVHFKEYQFRKNSRNQAFWCDPFNGTILRTTEAGQDLQVSARELQLVTLPEQFRGKLLFEDDYVEVVTQLAAQLGQLTGNSVDPRDAGFLRDYSAFELGSLNSKEPIRYHPIVGPLNR